MCICACQNVKQENYSIIIGFCCGECEGKCFQGYLISNDSVFKISGKYCDRIDRLNKVAADQNESIRVKEVLNSLPADFRKYEGTIGLPDTRDQCAVYLSFYNGYRWNKVIIDPDKNRHPEDLNRFVDKIQDLKLL